MIEMLLTTASVAAGIILGTFLTWLISYFIVKRFAGKFVKVIKENAEVKKLIDEAKSGKMFESILEKPEVKDIILAVREWLRRNKDE